jgi:DNA-binding CsgD family transcriptional regulator
VQLSNALFSTAEPAYAVDRDGVIRAWNHAAEDAFGYTQSEALNERCWELLAGQDLFGNRYCCAGCPLREMAFNHQSVNSNEMRFVTADKAVKRFRITRLLIACDSDNELLVHLCREQCEPGDGRVNRVAMRKPDVSARRGLLTDREKEILTLLSRGTGTRELAVELNLSRATVRNHIQSIFYKLHVHNRVAAVRRGRDWGLI